MQGYYTARWTNRSKHIHTARNPASCRAVSILLEISKSGKLFFFSRTTSGSRFISGFRNAELSQNVFLPMQNKSNRRLTARDHKNTKMKHENLFISAIISVFIYFIYVPRYGLGE